jgi:hypothetical protein
MEPTALKNNFYGRGEVRGFYFHLVEECPEKGYVYQVDNNQGEYHFEVFRHKINNSPLLETPAVSYPKSKAFGLWAWHYSDLTSALKKFQEICR